MSDIWNSIIDSRDFFVDLFETSGMEIENKKFNDGSFWINRKWESDLHYRSAHISMVDARKTKGLLMMHVCIFPRLDNDGPIFGYDVISGKNKITGIFCDFSPTLNQKHSLVDYFTNEVSNLAFIKKRELPDWGKQIFSDSIIAAGNVRQKEELNCIFSTIFKVSKYYIENISKSNYNSQKDLIQKSQENYCLYQKQNPHTPKTMIALGIDGETTNNFISECLFPKI